MIENYVKSLHSLTQNHIRTLQCAFTEHNLTDADKICKENDSAITFLSLTNKNYFEYLKEI